jgi:hypothetical protein
MTEQPRHHLHVISGDSAPPPDVARSSRESAFRTSWTADELMDTKFPEPRWAIPGLVAEGVSLLAGSPKIGKSWLSLGWALAVAGGEKAFDSVHVDGGDVLYLALEDTGRRLQDRIGKVLAGRKAPRGLTLATTCPTLPQGGDEKIAGWLDSHPDARLIIIDTFAKIRGRADSASAYDADYAAVGRVKNLADTYGVAVVLVHHVRKAAADDFLSEVSGTNGLAGAADATLVLKRTRGTADGMLHVTGRDIDETEYALSFQPAAGAWHLLSGPPEDHALSQTRAAIRGYVRANPGATPKQIATGTGLGYDNAKRTAARMAEDGQLRADNTGHYYPPRGDQDTGTVPAVPAVPELPLTSQDSEGQATVPAVPQVPESSEEEESG